ncbi:metallophosphoesterase [Pseudoalteromonas gelatinilytica]
MKNELGNDFAIGDIHGNLDVLFSLLENESFDFDHDRLFALGDIIDRGDNSEGCIALLNEKWFFSVLGNHEALFLKQVEENDFTLIVNNIGNEWLRKWQNKKGQLAQWATDIRKKMPLTITLNYPGCTIGLVHAKAPESWPIGSEKRVSLAQHHEEIWDRTEFYNRKELTPYRSTGIVLMGHNPVKKVTLNGNRIWLDTNHSSDHLSIVKVGQLVELFRK